MKPAPTIFFHLLQKQPWVAIALACWIGATCGWGQTPAPTPQDPLLSLLLAQPKVDFTRPVRVTTAFDPPFVKPGEPAIYRVIFNAMDDAIEWPEKLPLPPEIPARAGARAQLLQMSGPTMEPRTGFNYHFKPDQPGTITVPAFDVRVYGRTVTVPAATLQVGPQVPPSGTVAQMLEIQTSPTNAYVGEPVRVRILLPANWSGVQILSQVQVVGQGLVVDKSSVRQSIEPVGGGAPGRVAYVYEITATPITTGAITLFAQGWCAPNRPASPAGTGVMVIGGPIDYQLLDSDPTQIFVRPLPDSAAPGFTGSVGSLAIDPPLLVDGALSSSAVTNVVRLGEPVKLVVSVRGGANIARLVPPPPPQSPDWQVLPAQVDRSTPQMLHAKGAIGFTYTLIPLSEKIRETPEIPFSFFDPRAGKFVSASIPAIPVTVAPGGDSRGLQTILAARALPDNAPPDPVLSGLATVPGLSSASMVPLQLRPWFPLIQVAPALAFVGLWSWDRRRRYLRRHPDILIRRKARRALRRERRALAYAARAGDIPAYEAAAVRAVRIGCAPHLGAAASAMVGADVLQVLRQQGASNPEVWAIRKLFAENDASTFSLHPSGRSDLHTLAAPVDQVLNRLDRALCVSLES